MRCVGSGFPAAWRYDGVDQAGVPKGPLVFDVELIAIDGEVARVGRPESASVMPFLPLDAPARAGAFQLVATLGPASVSLAPHWRWPAPRPSASTPLISMPEDCRTRSLG